MAISLPSGFKITAQEPIDSRLIMTKAEMLNVKVGQMPAYYFVLCSEDQKIYIYDKLRSELDPVLGRFRPIEEFLTYDTPQAQVIINEAIKNSAEITVVNEKIDDLEESVDEISGTVSEVTTKVTEVIEPKVTKLESKVGDDTKGLVKKVNELDTQLEEDLKPRVDDLDDQIEQAEQDISDIQTWISHVKLDGGEIKAKYTLTPNISNVYPDSSNPTQVAYKGTVELNFSNVIHYTLPDTVKVSTVVVGSTWVDCGHAVAKWTVDSTATTGKLILQSVTNDIIYEIIGVAEV